MERKIGEKFEYAPGVWLEVVAGNGCFSCALFADKDCGIRRTERGNCSAVARVDGVPVVFVRCDPPAPEVDVTKERLEFTATGTIIQDAPPPSDWFKGLSDAWGAEILEAARDAFVYRFWDYPNTALALVMGVSEATVRRIRKKRLRKNKIEL